MNTRLISIEAAATMLDVSIDRAYTLAREGLLPAVRLGRSVKIDALRLDEWLRTGGKAWEGGWKREA